MLEVLSSFVETLVGGIADMATGIGTGVNQFVTDLFLTVGTNGAVEGLSVFGGVVAVFGGVSLAVGIGRLVFGWIRSIGN